MQDKGNVIEENVYLKYLLTPQLEEQAPRYFDIMLKINDAHALMLFKQELISRQEAKELLSVSQDIGNRGISGIELSAEREDLYLNLEAHIIQRLGSDIGGKLHIGRSRNDLYAAIQRIKCREELLKVAEIVIDLRETLVGLVEKNIETVIPGYTHMQPAQPITFGHYLAAIGCALKRDFDRLIDSYHRTNLNPLGAGAMAGTGFPIDRTLTGEYLGFDGILKNSLDAVAARDYAADIAYAMTMLLSDIGRMNQDFYYWVTSEFSTLKLPDEFVASSSIMPQKRNPIILEHTICKVSHVLGTLVSIVTTMKGLPYTHTRATGGEVFVLLWKAFQETETTIRWMCGLLEKIEIDRENAFINTRKNFSTATEVADELVRKMGLSFRTAHSIVRRAVFELYSQQKTSEDFTWDLLNRYSLEVLQKPLEGITEEDVRAALDPLENIKRRSVMGGPAPKEVKEQMTELKKQLQQDCERIEQLKNKIKSAQSKMKEQIDRVVNQ